MFWWLYYTSHNHVSNYTERPLIIWLQGGPGMPSSGYGNFLEIGPQNASFHKREGSFVENFNVLFVDNPVGVGYSYISDENTKLVTNGNEIGEDMYNFFKIFITTRHPEFQNVSVYVFGESYGGKMATEFVYSVTKKEKKDNLKFCNLKGLALGDAYISPLDYLEHYAPLALNLGLVDKRGFTRIDELAKQIQVLINKKEFKKAANTENAVIDLLYYETLGIDVNNILAKTNSTKLPKVWDYMYLLENMMNNEVKKELNITENITWKFFGDDLYQSLKGDLLKSVTTK
ncbi:Peptidase S10 domain containing protein, partial [Asbolus verrucosus]